MTALAIVAAMLMLSIACAWMRSLRKPPPDPRIEERIEDRAREAREARASAEALAHRLRVDRAENCYAARLRAAYREESR